MNLQDIAGEPTGPGPPLPGPKLSADAISGQPFWLNCAVNGLRRARPEFSAAEPMALWQRRFLRSLACLGLWFIYAAPHAGFEVAVGLVAVPFLCVVAARLYVLWSFVRQPSPCGGVASRQDCQDNVTDLPVYSVLIALNREADVAPALVKAMKALRYPPERLEFLFVTEADDDATRAALKASALAANMHILTVPEGAPQTKPRALNFALALATGEMVAVYDAEDIPDPDQLLCAVSAMRSPPEPLACVQARLNVYNRNESLVTRQFTLEYTALFDAILPALCRLGVPIPLGGTSNHFRRAELEAVGGWDPYNVTEDADLGFRLARLGKATGVIDSTTWEEAPVTARAWFGQRKRWLKGWMQTYLVHMRQPRRLLRELGLKRFLGFQILMAGMILSALVHPLGLWAVWQMSQDGALFAGHSSGAGSMLMLLGLLNLIASYASAIVLSVIASRRRGQGWLALWSLLIPVYWLAMSLASWRALIELCRSPYHWEKTSHSARPVTTGMVAP